MGATARAPLQGRLLTAVDTLIIFLLACYGATNIITAGKIFAWLQRKHAFFRCPMCVGFWVGVALAVIGRATGSSSMGAAARVGHVFVLGAASSGWCWMMRVALARLGEDQI